MLIRDPCGICCIIVTYFAIFYADYVVIRWIILETMQNSIWGPIHVVLFNTVVLLLGLSHLKAALTDPGTVPLPQTRLDFSDIHSAAAGGNLDPSIDPSSEWSVCARCETYRPPRAHHCRVCNRCIRRMDHHCPWINNCVGERNHRYFVLFLLYVAVLAAYAVTMVLISWLGKNEELEANETVQMKQTRVLHTVILLLESALFGMFVTAILFEQLQALAGNYDDEDSEPLTIDNSVSRNRLTRKSRTSQIKDICGRHTHPILWLLPFAFTERYGSKKIGSIHHHV